MELALPTLPALSKVERRLRVQLSWKQRASFGSSPPEPPAK
jgi:hypothetical protein